MRKLTVLLVLLCLVTELSAQEEVGPLMGNPQLQQKAGKKLQKVNEGTFDSTFIYTSDTIALPFFDEFSTSKFQKYNANHTDLGVTFDKVYRLLDMSSVPLPDGVFYTEDVTFLREIDVANGTITDTPFTPIQIQIGDLASYPVTHIPTDVYPPYYIYDTVDFVNDPDTIWIIDPQIYQDSATQFFATLNDPGMLWLDDEAYHNYSTALDPWSLGVVTFDGLDENGFAYALGSTTSNYADHLTSKPINMSTVDAGDSVYFSFLYQPEGYGDVPESSDSLILEFYAKDLDQWNWVWSTNGESVSDFKVAHIRIENSDYFKNGFQFRFKNYGGLSGSLDHFHIDYVNLRALSGFQDTIIHDFAFVYPIYTLLETFTSIPWDHYVNSPTGKMSNDVQVVVRNSDNIPENEQDGTTEIKYNTVTEGNFVLFDYLLNNSDLNYSPMTTYYSFHDFSSGDRFDETKPGPLEEFDIVSAATHLNSTFTLNDSTYSKQHFKNYYSYDDGSAEQSYGISGEQARLAIKYTPYEADSLIGALIHFVPSVEDVSNNLFLLTVWGDNGGVPGNVIYEDDIFFPRQPSYEYDRNIFTTYYFLDTMKVPVNGTFYVGMRQFDQPKLGVGLDRNIVNNDKTYYSVNGGMSWSQSNIQGSVMIRPLFSTSFDPYLGIKAKEMAEIDVQLYPNPTSDVINIRVDGMEYQGVEVYNLQGRKIIETEGTQVDLSDFPQGMYLFKPIGHSQTYKIIKQ